MASERDFLKTAERLIPSGRGRPARGDLSRAVSSAYYHVFHLLTRESARLYTDDPRLVSQLARTLSHKTLNDVSEMFRAATEDPERTAVQKLPAALRGDWLSRADAGTVADINRMANALVRLQARRHKADYDLATDVTKAKAAEAVSIAKAASEAVDRVREHQAFRLYVGCFFGGERWTTVR